MSNDGVTAGLKYWIIFMLGFVLLGYAPVLSIFLGAIAGLAGGFIVSELKAKNQTSPTPSTSKLGSRLRDVSTRFLPWKDKMPGEEPRQPLVRVKRKGKRFKPRR